MNNYLKFAVLFFAVFTLFSCSDDGDAGEPAGPEFFMMFEVDGEEFLFPDKSNSDVIGANSSASKTTQTNGLHEYVVTSENGNVAQTRTYKFTIFTDSLATGTYKATAQPTMLNQEPFHTLLWGGVTFEPFIPGSIPESRINVSLTLTRHDNGIVEGTMEGSFYSEDAASGEIIKRELTNGIFPLLA